MSCIDTSSPSEGHTSLVGYRICALPQARFLGSVNFVECVSNGAVDSFAYMERGECLCILLIRGVVLIYYYPFLVKEERK